MSAPSSAAEGLRLRKGHGTENDFVILDDLEGRYDLSPSAVRRLCDRRAGIGGDGLLRIVQTSRMLDLPPTVADAVADTDFFMDYRNADGSVGDMCGNGLRVFVRALQESGLLDVVPGDSIRVGTRAGPLDARIEPDGQITVDLGAAGWPGDDVRVSADLCVGSSCADWSGAQVSMPNPHVVVIVDDVDQLEGLDLSRAPRVSPALPHGQNVEFVTRLGDHHLRMRVHERGVGETRSCGTGIGAVASVFERATGGGQRWLIDVPGGRCSVVINDDEHVLLTGPAQIVADVKLRDEQLAIAFAGR